MIQAAKIIGTGSATAWLIGAGVGIWVVFGALILGIIIIIIVMLSGIIKTTTIEITPSYPGTIGPAGPPVITGPIKGPKTTPIKGTKTTPKL